MRERSVLVDLQEFTKVLSFNLPFQFLCYIMTASIVYAYVGKNAGKLKTHQNNKKK
jgi:hypothetical protein